MNKTNNIKENLLPNQVIENFFNTEKEALHVIECLKKTGMEIKDIKQFMTWCSEEASTYPKRKELFNTFNFGDKKTIQMYRFSAC